MLRTSEFWGGLFWLVVGGYIVHAGRDLGLGSLHEPGSGFAFYWIGILMCGLAAVVVAQSLIYGGPALSSLWVGTRWGRVLFVIALLLVYGMAFESLGFIVCTLALLLALMWFVDYVGWFTAIVVSLGATFGVWFALTKWLKIQLPSGVLAGILG